MHIHILPIFLLVGTFLLHNAHAHPQLDSTPFDQHADCPCQCRIDPNALTKAYAECHMYSYHHCTLSFCLTDHTPGLSCCYEHQSRAALLETIATLDGVQYTAEAQLMAEPYSYQSAEPYINDHYDRPEQTEPYLVNDAYGSEPSYSQLLYEHSQVAFSSQEPCEHVTVLPSTSASPTATPTATPTPSVTSSATPTRTPSTSPSPTMTPSVSPSPSPKFATLHYAADNEAFVYVNGVLISALTDWRLFETISFPLKRNDVVAILAQDNGGWYGFIAALHVADRWYVTGRDEWKAIKAFEFPGDDELWTVPFFNTCSWDLVEARPNADVIFNGKAPDFPYDTGAQYVWADDAGENDTIFVRFVLGGEDCS